MGRWWNETIGHTEDTECLGCRMEQETPDYIMFWCKEIRQVKEERGRREWVSKDGMRWDGQHALASKKWARMENSGHVDNEGRPILEGGFDGDVFRGRPPLDLNHVFRCLEGRLCICVWFFLLGLILEVYPACEN